MTASSLTIETRPGTGPAAHVRRFLAWWSRELSDVVAASTAKARAWRVMILRSERGVEVYLRSRDRPARLSTSAAGLEQPLAELARRVGRGKVAPAEIVLRLQPGEVVQTRLSVPAAAGDVLEPVVRNQIERLAPWPADKALFTYETALAADGSATLDVRLAVAARSLVDGLVAELNALGFAPGVVDFGADATAEPRLNLLSAHAAASGRSGRRILSFVGLVCAASVIAGALGAAGLVQQTRELDAVNVRLQELHDKAAALLPSQASARRQAWLAAQRATPPSLAVMGEAP